MPKKLFYSLMLLAILFPAVNVFAQEQDPVIKTAMEK